MFDKKTNSTIEKSINLNHSKSHQSINREIIGTLLYRHLSVFKPLF